MAKMAIEQDQFRSNRAAAASFNVNKDTLRNRRNGIPSRRDCVPNSKKLSSTEEKVIISHVLDVDERGFQLNYDMLRDIANKLLSDRGQPNVGINGLQDLYNAFQSSKHASIESTTTREL